MLVVRLGKVKGVSQNRTVTIEDVERVDDHGEGVGVVPWANRVRTGDLTSSETQSTRVVGVVGSSSCWTGSLR